MIAINRMMSRFAMMVLVVFMGFSADGMAAAEVGKTAPAFKLKDGKGKEHALSDYKGKYVVLEWINPNCPFVVKHYSAGNMQALQKKYTGKGVIWLAINSTNPKHKDYHTPENFQKHCEAVGASITAALMDADGKVGREYGAKTTPHMFIISPEGKVIYNGAIDSVKSTNSEDIEKADNYVQKALDEALAGKKITKSKTAPYGCGVKYAKR